MIVQIVLSFGFIYNELRIRGSNADVGVVEVSGRADSRFTRKQFEVDLVANLGSKRYYIQSAFAMSGEEKTEQEIQSLKRKDDSFKKIIIVKDDIKVRRDNNGFVTMGVFDFLLNENSLEFELWKLSRIRLTFLPRTSSSICFSNR